MADPHFTVPSEALCVGGLKGLRRWKRLSLRGKIQINMVVRKDFDIDPSEYLTPEGKRRRKPADREGQAARHDKKVDRQASDVFSPDSIGKVPRKKEDSEEPSDWVDYGDRTEERVLKALEIEGGGEQGKKP